MTGIPSFYSITAHARHQQAALLAEANRDRRASEAARGAPDRPAATRHLAAIVAGVLLLAFLLAVSVASA